MLIYNQEIRTQLNNIARMYGTPSSARGKRKTGNASLPVMFILLDSYIFSFSGPLLNSQIDWSMATIRA
jgi:hypothetical protein